MDKEIEPTKSVSTRPVPADITSATLMAEFLDQPVPKIAEAITGALEVGTQGMVVAGARIAQGALKGQFLKQLGREIRNLIEKGKIPEDYADKKYGFQSLSELLKFIDEEDVDEDRLFAVKAMFYALNKSGNSSGEELLNYQLFKLSKELSASQLLLLRAAYSIKEDVIEDAKNEVIGPVQKWIVRASAALGHDIQTLVVIDESVLVEKRLIGPRVNGSLEPVENGRNIRSENGRLTDLGDAFCKNIIEFDEISK